MKPDGPVMCSRACFFIHHASPTFTCPTCGKDFKHRGGKVGERHFCSPACTYVSLRADPATTGHKARTRSDYRKWQRAVLKRDDYRCQSCGVAEGLHAHHVQAWRDFPALRFDVANGRTLCAACHARAHGTRMNPVGHARKTCEHCGVAIRGRTGFTRCRSCAAKYSPKAIAVWRALKPYHFRPDVPSPRWKRPPPAPTPPLD
jgi:5-methylcytosine-specific restriction endonuclease McrA